MFRSRSSKIRSVLPTCWEMGVVAQSSEAEVRLGRGTGGEDGARGGGIAVRTGRT